MENETKKCPHCGAEIMATAKKCRFCGKWLEEMQPSVTTDQLQEPQIQENPSNKKTLIGGIVLAVVLLIGGILCYQHISSENAKATAEATAKKQKQDYMKAAKDFREAATYIHETGKEVLEDYSTNWKTSIYENYAYNAEGNKQHCSDFNKGVDWRIEYFMKEGTLGTLRMKMETLSECQKAMSKLPIPKGMENIQGYFDQVRSKASEVVGLCSSPEGNYDSFHTRIFSLCGELHEAITKTDVYFE